MHLVVTFEINSKKTDHISIQVGITLLLFRGIYYSAVVIVPAKVNIIDILFMPRGLFFRISDLRNKWDTAAVATPLGTLYSSRCLLSVHVQLRQAMRRVEWGKLYPVGGFLSNSSFWDQYHILLGSCY